MSKKYSILELLIVILVLAIDLYTKYIIKNTYTLFQSKEIISDFFYITYVQNKGAAWGILQNQKFFFIGITLIAMIVIMYYYHSIDKKQYLVRIGLCLLFGGLLGNFYDRLFIGYVTDFLDFYIFGYNFPVFNVADMGICIGIGCILLDTMIGEYRQWKFNQSHVQ